MTEADTGKISLKPRASIPNILSPHPAPDLTPQYFSPTEAYCTWKFWPNQSVLANPNAKQQTSIPRPWPLSHRWTQSWRPYSHSTME